MLLLPWWAGPSHTRLYSFRFSCRMVSFTAANTKRMFSVSATTQNGSFQFYISNMDVTKRFYVHRLILLLLSKGPPFCLHCHSKGLS